MRRSPTRASLRLSGLLRLLVLALVAQLAGSMPALARVFDVASQGSSEAHACPCCAERDARERAERALEGVTPSLASWSAPDCCGSGPDDGNCAGGCASCQGARDAKLLATDGAATIAVASGSERLAAPSLKRRSVSPPHLPSIYRPPCARTSSVRTRSA